MKLFNRRKSVFIIGSFLWAILLYSAMMVACNWDEVRNSVTGKNNITVIKPSLPEPVQPAVNNPVTPNTNPGHGVIVKGIIAVLRTISGISEHSASH